MRVGKKRKVNGESDTNENDNANELRNYDCDEVPKPVSTEKCYWDESGGKKHTPCGVRLDDNAKADPCSRNDHTYIST